MSENNFMLLSRTKGPLINVDGETSESPLQQTLANRAFFKSTPSLAPSIQSSINSYKNEYVFEPISQKPKSNPNLSAHQRELFTPDSLESTLSSCSLTDSDDENYIINRDKESLDEEDEHVKSKTDSGLSLSPQLTHSSSTSDDKHFDLDIDFETDEEICQLTENKNETSISILEKLDKINRLQQKINDINLKIKSIDMNSDDQNCDLDQQEKNLDENFRNRNNQTRMAIRTQQSHNFHDDQNNQSSSSSSSNNNNKNNNKNIDDDDDDHIDFDQDNYDEYSDDEDEQNEDDYYTIVQQAQPIKKYASTGFLFNRFGSYLAPIEEAPEEMLKSSSNSSIVSTDSSDYLLPQSAAAYLTKKTSTSCFNLELRDKSETSSSDHSSNQATNTLINSTFNAVDAAKLVDHDLFWADVPDSSLFIEREEFVDSSSLIESLYVEKEECSEECDQAEEDDKSTPKVLDPIFKMVDVFDSPETYAQNDTVVDPVDGIIPEDNVERLRNIRDMFESRQEDDLIELKKVEKLQPSEKLKQTFLNDKQHNQSQEFIATSMMDEAMDDRSRLLKLIDADSMCMYESHMDDEAASLSASPLSSVPCSPNNDSLNQQTNRFEEGVVEQEQEELTKNGNKDIMPFAELNNVKTKFENISMEASVETNEPKPMRAITPPREGADRVEIENEPMARAADVVSVYERVEETMPDAGYIKSRREIFNSPSSSSGDDVRRKKSITPPRDDILKRVLKEKTPDRLENVIRESDRSEEALPSAGSTRQTAAIFSSGGARQRSIDRSGITIEGELAEKGIAKSRLALFSDPTALCSPPVHSHAADQELDLIKNGSSAGIAKERLSLFKNLEQSNGQRASPDRTLKKLKEFTPPPQMEPRQYIIIDKQQQQQMDEEWLPSTPSVDTSAYNKDEFVPESGLAKNRMKQYLDQASSNSGANETSEISETSELQGKGLAKSLLAKWKSIENIKDLSPPADASKRPIVSPNEDDVPVAGTARNLLTKWQNIDTTNTNKENWERKALKAFTPPPSAHHQHDQYDHQMDNDHYDHDHEHDKTKQQVYEDELALLKGAAKNTLKKFEQSLAESNNRVKRTVTPPKQFISQIGQAPVKTVFESQPVESNINAHYAEEEIIPPQGYAKNLKQKFLNLEKEAAKIETSSAKMNYVPRKFTSSTSPAYQNKDKNTAKQPPSKQVGKLNANGLLTAASNGQTGQTGQTGQNGQNGQNGQSNEKCAMCDKTVYAMEKFEADKKVYHKACFKCTSCNCPLKLGNFSSIKQTLYCTPHFLQLFARNGNYDEGFGLENYKRKWLPSQQNAQTTAAN